MREWLVLGVALLALTGALLLFGAVLIACTTGGLR